MSYDRNVEFAALAAANSEILSMPTIRASFGSPYGRKARIAVSILGLDGKIKIEPAATQDPARQKEIYLQAQKLLLVKYAVMVPLFYPDRYYRLRHGLEGLGIDPFNFLTFRSAHI